MSGFERMNTEEREPFDAYVLRQQNRALRAAVAQKRRRVHELSRALAEQRRAHQASAAMVACADRHWRQLETDARLLLGGAAGAAEDGTDSKMAVDGEEAGAKGLVERVLLPKGLDRVLLADVTKLAEAVAAGRDPGGLDEVMQYEDEEGEGWLAGFELGQEEGEENGDADAQPQSQPKRKRGAVKREEDEGNGAGAEREEELPAVEQAVQQRCAAVRALLGQVGQVLLRESSSAAASAAEGPSPPSPAVLVEGQRRLQAECALLRDRLVQARRTQAELYRGLIRALKDRHRLLRPWDWGLEGAGGAPQGVKSENGGEAAMANGSQGAEGACCHGEHKSTGQQLLAGHKRRRSEAGGGNGGAEEGEGGGSELATALAAAKERAEEQEGLARARLEEAERLRGEKAALERRVTELVAAAAAAAAASESSSRQGRGSSPGSGASASEAQVRASALFRQAAGERDSAVAEREAAGRRAASLAREAGELRHKCALLVEEKRQAVEQERGAWQPRLEELQREVHALRRATDEAAAEAEAGKGLRRQLDELKAALDAERAELEGAREVRRQQAEEVKGLRAECAALRDRLALAQQAGGAPVDAEVAKLRGEVEGLQGFKDSLLEETESLTATYEELSAAHARLKQQGEERERRQLRLQDDALRARVGDKLQAEKMAQLERRAHAAEALRRQQEEAVRALSEQLARAQERWQGAMQEKAAAEERVEGQIRAAHAAEGAKAAAEEAKGAAEGKAATMARRAEELAGQLEAAEAERLKLREKADALERKLQRTQGQLDTHREASQGAGGSSGPAAGGGGGISDTVVEGMRKMLNCSVCNVRFKDTVITKCSHLFCRQCVDENLKVRSRKCPACGKGYAVTDVKPFFFT